MQTENKNTDETFTNILKVNEVNNRKNIEQRPRSSGFKLFLNWFKKIENNNRLSEYDDDSSLSDYSDEENKSHSSSSSTATVESFAFLPANIYKPFGDACQAEKYITPGPYTETYRRLITERNKRRCLDKNISLRKKYSLYSSGTLSSKVSNRKSEEPKIDHPDEEIRDVLEYNTFSLPTRAKQGIDQLNINIVARKTASLSTKQNKTPCHVKGKRKAPLPPTETIKTFRKKRQAPTPPDSSKVNLEENKNKLLSSSEVNAENDLYEEKFLSKMPNSKCDITPKPWYKRQSTNEYKEKQKHESKKKEKYEFPEVGFFRCTRIFDNKKPYYSSEDKTEKRISCFLPNISELDREATEILKHKNKLENNSDAPSDIRSKPSSARDLINKFNALTNYAAKRDNIIPQNNEITKSPIVAMKPLNSESKQSHINKEEVTNVNNITSSEPTAPEYIKKPSLLQSDFSGSFQAEVFSALPTFKDCFKYELDKIKNIDKPSSSNSIDMEEKARLKEMLKEMKNSLPKRPKPSQVTKNPESTVEDKSNVRDKSNIEQETVITNQAYQKSIFNTNQINDIAAKYKDKPEIKQSNQKTKDETQPILQSQFVRLREKNKVSSSSQTNCSVKKSDLKSQLDISNVLNSNPTSGETSVSSQPASLQNHNDLYMNITDAEITKKISPEKQIDLNLNLVLKQLEEAIADGNHILAAKLAKDLALLKVKCSVTTSNNKETPNETIYKSIQIYIEDKFSHQGPISMNIKEDFKLIDLKNKVSDELNIPIGVQKWIINKHLADNDDLELEQCNGGKFDEPLFLYVVSQESVKPAQETKKVGNNISYKDKIILNSTKFSNGPLSSVPSDMNLKMIPSTSKLGSAPANSSGIMNNVNKKTWVCSDCTLVNSLLSPICSACGTKKNENIEAKTSTDVAKVVEKANDHYLQLIYLDKSDLVTNSEEFECFVCLNFYKPKSGVVLRECLHTFCKECLANVIKYCEEVEVKCPYRDKDYSCDSILQEREIKALVNKSTYEKHLAKSVTIAENKIQNAFHCKTPNCKGWCIYEENVNYFKCPLCKKVNCLNCQTIHEEQNCKEYQESINDTNDKSFNEAQRTKKMLQEMVARGEAMECPSCKVVLMKKWGCDWVKCSMCKTEICWVTRGARWGPAGKGDTSAGCQCGVNGIKCHPKCNYCH